MTTDERLSLDTQINKENLSKLEKQVSDLRVETVQLTTKYLEGFNKILEAQSEGRSCDKQLSQDLVTLKEKIILLDSTIEKLQAIDAYSEIKRFIEHIKSEKETVDHINVVRDFMSTQKNINKLLLAAAGAFATVLLGMLISFLTKLLGG